MVARASGKVILLGEHGVVHGRPAIALGITRGVTASTVAEPETKLTVQPWNVTVSERVTDADTADQPPLAAAFRALCMQHPRRGRPVHVHADVELPAGAGLGCSAALGVAVLRALDAAWGAPHDDVATRVLPWEQVFHGTPSGIDSAVAASGGLVFFRRGEPLERLSPRQSLWLVVADTGERTPTREMVEAVHRQHARAPERVEKVLDGMASLVQNARLAIAAGDLPQLGQLMKLNQVLLNSLMLSTARLEELCEAARAAGALGAKLTGGGGGGCMIALGEDETAAAAIAAALGPFAADVFVTGTS